jgi:hypothetical protein
LVVRPRANQAGRGIVVEISTSGGTVVSVGDRFGDEEIQTEDGLDVIADDGVHPDGDETGIGEPVDDAPPTRFDRVRRSTAGVMMTGIALGLQDALELPKKQPAFVIKASGQPDGPQGPIDLSFDPDDPSNTVAVIRPWLTDGKKKETPPE